MARNRLDSWSHPILTFIFPWIIWSRTSVSSPAHCCPFIVLPPAPPLPRPLPVYDFGPALDLPLQLPRWPLMVYFLSESISVLLCPSFQDKLSGRATWTSRELTCLRWRSAVVCHTFQIKGSQDGQCLQDAGLCRGLWLPALSTGRVCGRCPPLTSASPPPPPPSAEWFMVKLSRRNANKRIKKTELFMWFF